MRDLLFCAAWRELIRADRMMVFFLYIQQGDIAPGGGDRLEGASGIREA